MNVSFEGKTALVTGGTRGIGKAIVDGLRAAGAEVYLTGTASENNEPGYVGLNLEDDDSITQFSDVVSSLNRLDILVNNAGINTINPIEKIKVDDWERILKVNLTGAMKVSQVAVKKMKAEQTQGRILNITSIFAHLSKEYRAAYSASKSGMLGLSRAMALDLAPDGILVNCLSPGFTKTDLTRRVLGDEGMAELAARVPLGRMAEVDEIAKTALFLVSDENSYITGQSLIIDGGFVIQ